MHAEGRGAGKSELKFKFLSITENNFIQEKPTEIITKISMID
jgi:hypothetical protein